MIGQQIGNYQILDKIGSGGFGVVYRAYEVTVEREVSVKVILPEHANRPDFQQRFELEARLVAKLEHPHIIPLYNFWQDDQGAFLIMRYVQGGSLRELMRQQGALSLVQTSRLVGHITEALSVAHEAGVIHRDLKPENILLDRRGNAYLTDFGIAKDLGNPYGTGTQSDAVVGSPNYLSPEQARNESVTPRTDIYSLGVIVYEMLAGEHPFPNVKPVERIYKHIHDPLPDVTRKRPDLPVAINRIVARATAKVPADRYAAAHEVAAALNQPADEEATAVLQRETSEGPATVAVPAPLTDRNRAAMIQNVRTFWVKGVLENSLHGAVMIELGMKPEMGAVDHPWDTLLRTPGGEERLPAGTRMATVFERLNGKVLILGDPGSGKSTILLDLARDLLHRADADHQHPIPVVFNLVSWSEKQPPLTEWLVEELSGKYQVPRRVGREWVESDDLLLLLDGLDEVAADRRDACVQAINAYREEHGFVDVVVCSRMRDYEALTHRLKLNGAIVIQPLEDTQIMHYLDTLGTQVTAVRDLITRDHQLRELAQSPLMLSIMVLAYRDISGRDVPDFDDVEAQRQHLFDTYIERMFEHRIVAKPCTEEETRHYLIWLAKQMQAHAVSVFHIEGLQPDWLTAQQQRAYHRRVLRILVSLWALWLGGTHFLVTSGFGASRMLSGLLFPLSGGLWGLTFTGNRWRKLSYHVLWGFVYGTIMGIVIAGTYGAARALLFGGTTIFNGIMLSYEFGFLMTALGHNKDHIQLAENLRFSRTNIKPAVVGSIGLIGGSLVIITPRFVFGPATVPVTRFIAGIMVSALLLSLILLYYSGLTANTVESRTQPNQGTRWSFRNANRLAGLALILCALLGVFGMALVMPLIGGISLGLMIGANLCSQIWVPFGGYTVVQHVALRSILHRDGHIPQNYARFLNYAASLILLRKVGGGYVFIHRYLLEHFAAQESLLSDNVNI